MIPLELRLVRRLDDGIEDDIVVHVADSSVTIRDLAQSLGLSGDLRIDGRTLRGDVALLGSGIGHGSTIEAASSSTRPQRPGSVTLHQIGGLAAGGSISLDPGRYAIGPVGPVRGELRLGATGSPRFVLTVYDHGGCELTPGSGDPVLVDSQRLAHPMQVTTQLIDADGALFRITPDAPPFSRRRADYRGEIQIDQQARPSQPSLASLRVTLPPSGTGSRRRARLKADAREALRHDLERARTAAVAIARTALPDLAEYRARICEQAPILWDRAETDSDLLNLTALIGDMTWSPVDPASPPNEAAGALVSAASQLTAVPLPLPLLELGSVDLLGPRHATLAVARRLVLEAAALTGPTLLRISIAAPHLRTWDFLKWLPHFNADAAGYELLIVDGDAEVPPAHGRTRVIMALRPGDEGAGPRLFVDALGRCTFADGTDRPLQTGTAIGISASLAATMARGLAPLRFADRDGGPPRVTAISDILELDDPVRRSDAILGRWQMTKGAPVAFVPVGRSSTGLFELAFAEGSHVLVAGTAASGRSTALQTLTLAIAATCSPAATRIILIDGGGENTFEALVGLPQVVEVAIASRSTLASDSVDGWPEPTALGDRPDDLLHALETAEEPYDGTTFVLVDDAVSLVASSPLVTPMLDRISRRPRTHLILASRRASALLAGTLHDMFGTRLVLDPDVEQDPVLLDHVPAATRGAVGLRPGLAWSLRAGHDPVAVQLAAVDTEPGTSRNPIEVRPFWLSGGARPNPSSDALEPFVNAVREAARRGGWLQNSARDTSGSTA